MMVILFFFPECFLLIFYFLLSVHYLWKNKGDKEDPFGSREAGSGKTPVERAEQEPWAGTAHLGLWRPLSQMGEAQSPRRPPARLAPSVPSSRGRCGAEVALEGPSGSPGPPPQPSGQTLPGGVVPCSEHTEFRLRYLREIPSPLGRWQVRGLDRCAKGPGSEYTQLVQSPNQVVGRGWGSGVPAPHPPPPPPAQEGRRRGRGRGEGWSSPITRGPRSRPPDLANQGGPFPIPKMG